MSSQQLIDEIKRIEALRYDKEIVREQDASMDELIKLYNELGQPLSDEDKAEVLRAREIEMIDSAGQYSELDVNDDFEDDLVQ